MNPRRYEDALEVMLGAATPVPTETISAGETLGRVLSADVLVPHDTPDLPRSAMDGFAVGAIDREAFRIVGEVAAGALPSFTVARDEAAAVMTGAVIPEGACAVVMVERCRRDGPVVHVDGEIRDGDLINHIGSEAKCGDRLAAAGDVVGGALYPALHCAGVAKVQVHRRPRLGMLVTGDEVRGVEEGAAAGQVFDTNSFTVAALARGLGCDVEIAPRLSDDEAGIDAAMANLADRCDVVVTSGGVSVGRYDFVGKIVRARPDDLLLAGTLVKPGRPLHVARLSAETLLFAMPGYPASLLTNAYIYLAPVLRRLAGRRRVHTRWLNATLGDTMRYGGDCRSFHRARLDLEDGAWIARSPGSHLASHFLNFGRVDGLVRMPDDEHGPALSAGADVPVLHLELERS